MIARHVASMGGRTFFLTLGCGVVVSILLWFGKLDSGAYSTIVLGTVGVYITANAYQKGVELNANKDLAIAAGTPPPIQTQPTQGEQ